MNIKFAILDENDNIIKESRSLCEIEDLSHELRKRRTGKTTRTIFTALGSNKDVIIVVPNTIRARHLFTYILTILSRQGFESVKNETYLTIKPKYSGKITLISEDKRKSVGYNKNYEDGCLILEDLD